MDGKSHFVVGASCGILASAALSRFVSDTSGAELFYGGVIGAIYGILPDIDTPNSYISNVGKKNIIFFVLWLPVKIFSILINKIFGHRGLVHTVFLAVAFSFPMLFLRLPLVSPVILFISALAGYLSHLLCDMTTKSGVRVLYPISKQPIYILPRSLRILSQSKMQYLIVLIIVLITGILTYYLYVWR